MEQKQHLDMIGIYNQSSNNTHIQYQVELKQYLEMNGIYNQSSNNTHIQNHMEPKQHLEMNGIYKVPTTPMQHPSSTNWNTQLHNIISHGTVTPQTISHFTAPPIGL
jgi:hypothetical protein